MSNVTTISRPLDYWVGRAAKHRRAGRYDEAMALLWKARNQFGVHEEIELEMARTYEEMGCDEQAARCYLRVVRQDGRYRAKALFQLAMLSMQRGDTSRALGYYEQFAEDKTRAGIAPETDAAFGEQLLETLERPGMHSRKARARALKHRAAARLQEGKTAAAEHLILHSLRLYETAQGYTLLACCCLLRKRFPEAAEAALKAHCMAPAKVQTLCVLADAYAAMNEEKLARKSLYLAAMRARQTDDLLAVSLESAKLGDDQLTLRMTRRLLNLQPYHIHGMMLRACALTNMGRLKEASRLFGRLSGLLPEDTVCEFLYKLTRDGEMPQERLTLGVEVPYNEGVRRASELISLLYLSPEEICAEPAQLHKVCRMCDWAFHTPLAGAQTKLVASILMGALQADEAREVLLDALTEPQLSDSVKLSVLQALAAQDGFKVYDADLGGRLVRVAAARTDKEMTDAQMTQSDESFGGKPHEVH